LDQFLPFVITIIAILLTDLLIGVLIGICVGIFFVMRSNFRTSVFIVHDDNKYLFRLRKDVSFLNKPIIKNKLEEIPANSTVIIDASRADFIDKDVIEVIEDFLIHAPLKNIDAEVKVSPFQNQGFNPKVLRANDTNENIIRQHDKTVQETEAGLIQSSK
jgi:MFS superfamily sulfate permease-like transporter